MNIHKFIVPFMLGIILLLVGACSKNEQGSPYSDGIVLRFNPVGSVTRTIGSVDPGTDAENTIDNVVIWCYPKNATDDAIPLYSEKITGVNSVTEAKISLTEKKLGAANMTVHGTYDIYVVANLPAEATIDANATLGELKQYSYTVSSRPSSPFSMSGNSIACDFSKGNETEIPLYRHAVKLGITLINETSSATWTINSVTIRNDQKTLYLFQELATASASNAFTTDLVVSATPVNADTATYLAYINENLSDVPTIIEVNATIGAENKKYVAKITPDGAAKLVRNSLCMATLRLKDAIVNGDFITTDWLLEEIDAPLPQTYLIVSTNTLSIDIASGADIIVISDAEKITIDWSNAINTVLEGYLSVDKTTINLTTEETVFHFVSNAAIATPPSGFIVIKTGNIVKKINIEKKATNLIFDNLSVTMGGVELQSDTELPYDLSRLGPITVTVNANVTWYFSYQRYAMQNGVRTNIDTNPRQYICPYNGTVTVNTLKSPALPNNNTGMDYYIDVFVGLGNIAVGNITWEATLLVKKM